MVPLGSLYVYLQSNDKKKKTEDFHTALIIISHVIQLGGGGCKGLPVKHLIRSNI